MGHLQTFDESKRMSALPPKADARTQGAQEPLPPNRQTDVLYDVPRVYPCRS
jgi:hypothetical protein